MQVNPNLSLTNQILEFKKQMDTFGDLIQCPVQLDIKDMNTPMLLQPCLHRISQVALEKMKKQGNWKIYQAPLKCPVCMQVVKSSNLDEESKKITIEFQKIQQKLSQLPIIK